MKFDRCKNEADRIVLEYGKRVSVCELHGRHKKLVAMIDTKIEEPEEQK